MFLQLHMVYTLPTSGLRSAYQHHHEPGDKVHNYEAVQTNTASQTSHVLMCRDHEWTQGSFQSYSGGTAQPMVETTVMEVTMATATALVTKTTTRTMSPATMVTMAMGVMAAPLLHPALLQVFPASGNNQL